MTFFGVGPTARRAVLLRAAELALVTATIAASGDAQAQTIYVANQLTQPFVPLGSGASVVLDPLQNWNDQSVLVPIGFSFTYYGVAYDFIEVADNGYVSFKPLCNEGCDFDEFCDFNTNACFRSWASTGDWEGLPSTTTPNRVVAPFWDDLILDTTAPASVVQTRLLGASPNRELVIEWRNMRHVNFSRQPIARTSFQLRLREGSNNLRFHYGPFTQGPDNADWSGRIGLEDPFGVDGVIPVACAQNQGFCDWSVVAGLNNQVIEIGIPNVPELTGDVEPLLGAQPGDVVTLSARVRNVGLQPTTTPIEVAFYLSTDGILTPGLDTLLGTATVGLMDAASNAVATTTVTMPAVPTGYYTLGALFDSSGVVTEATENNNTSISPEAFLVGSDLEAFFANQPLPQPPGRSGELSFDVTNRSSAADHIMWRVVLSADTTIDPTDAIIAEGTSSFGASQQTTVTTTTTIPAGALPGYYTLIVEVDTLGVLSEADEFNNVGYGFVIVGPDAYPTGITAPPRSGAGAILPVTLSIENQGSVVDDIEYQLYLSTDPSFELTDLLLASGTTSLAPSYEERLDLVTNVPEGLAAGTYYFIGVVDPLDSVLELDEINNIAVLGSIDFVGPDLAVESVDGRSLLFRGLSYTIDASLTNQGGEPVRDFYVSFHLSVNQLITTSDPMLVELGPYTLQPGESVTINHALTIPVTTARGTYWLGAIADSRSAIPNDSHLQNNIRRGSAQVIVRDPAPDFLITELAIPTDAGAGEVFPAQRTLENQGNAAGTVSYEIYLVSQSTATRFALVGRGTATLDAGQLETAVDTLTVPASIAAGSYRIEYDLDPENTVDEIVDDNNVTVSEASVTIDASGLLITTTTLPFGTVGLPYEVKLDARGGTAALTWSVASGTLPSGLELEASTGRIAGTPTAEGRASFVVRVTDGALVDERSMSLLVADSTVELRIATRSLPPVWASVDYDYPLTALGGVPPYAWRVSPDLPLGLTITSSGAVAGKTSTTAPSNVYTFTVTDAVGERVSLPMALRVLARDNALRFDMGALSDGIVGSTYDATMSATNGIAPYTFALAGGALPPGLSIDNGHLTGVPVRQGTYAFQVRVEDSVGDFDVEYFVVTVESSDGITFVTKGLPFAVLGEAYVDGNDRPVFVKAISTGTSTSITYALANGTLPAGLALDGDGHVRGTPTAAGVSAFTVIATNDLGETDVRAFGLSVVDLTPDPLAPSEDDGCGCTTSTTSPTSGRGLGVFFAIAGLLALRLRRRGLGVLASLVVALGVLSPSTASAQRGDGGVVVGPDAGVGGGGAGTAQYFTSTRTEAYVERTGGTALRFRSNDDDWQPYTLPFAFRYYESDFGEVRVSTNGYVSFTDDAYSYGNEPIPSVNTPNNAIFLVWDDLWTTDVTVHEEGTAPNRVVIIQWRNSSQLGDQARTFNMQLWLFEGPSARFQLWYGPNNGVSQGTSFSASTGYEDLFGARGETLLACTPNCGNADIGALPDTVFEVLQDAGEDLNAARVEIPNERIPLRVYQGVPFDVISTINSYHGSPIGPFSYALHLLLPGETTPSSPAFFTSAPVTLSPYQSLSATDAVTIPISTPEGRYRIALVVDPSGGVTEPNEDNNFVIGGQELLIGERQPDLRVADVQVTGTSAAPGSMMPVSVTLENFGNLDTSASWKLVLSPNSSPSTEDLVLHASSPLALAAASTETVTLDVAVPATVRPGRYYVGAVMDPENTIREISEVNNTGRTRSAVFIGSAAVELLTAQLPAAYVGVDYDVRLESGGGDGQYVYELLGGTLPAGLAFTPGTGRITGKPTATADASLTFRVTSNGQNDTATLALEVLPADGPLTIVTRRLLPGTVGVPYPPAEEGQDPANQQRIVTVGGDDANVTFSLTGQPPTGLVLDPDGYLHGVPTGRGNYTMTVSATDGVETTTRELSITVVEAGRLSILAGPLPDATLGQPYAFAFYVTGRQAEVALTYSLAAGTLPEGLTLANDGELLGTPGEAGVYSFAVEVSEAGALGARDSAWFRLAVDAPATLGIFPSGLPDAVIGVPYQVTMEARQGTAPYAWTVAVNGELPQGLAWSLIEESGEAKIRIAGTPEALPGVATQNTDTGGVVALLVTLSDGEGRSYEQSFALRVVEAPKPPTTTDSGGCICVTAERTRELDGALGLVALLGLALFVRSRREKTQAVACTSGGEDR